MFSSTWRSRSKRRGVVLILILGMLGLMALIGVTFATFAGQQLTNNRNYNQSINLPSPEQLMDYALSQLINDTNNPMSSLRGHSLLRDMYGNDSLMTGNSSSFRALLDRLPDGTSLAITAIGAYPSLSNGSTPLPTPNVNLNGYYQVRTNIPVHSGYPQLYGVDFTRWVMRLTPNGSPVAQSIEVLHDDVSGTYHVLTLAPGLTAGINTANTVNNDVGIPGDRQSRIYTNPNFQTIYNVAPASGTGPAKALVQMTQPTSLGSLPLASQFVLDGRGMRAFNGPGASVANTAGLPDAGFYGVGQPHNSAAYANFRTNGALLAWPFVPNINTNTNNLPSAPTLGDPNLFGLDEDYDACDLENWFLAIQSADGQVMIPSFHRPGILAATYDANGNLLTSDWRWDLASSNLQVRQQAVMAVSKILRPRQIDHTPDFPADPERPDSLTGQIKYDVDNDGDGVTDSVWLDLGYPVSKDSRGKLFKPLFAFMVIGLNGRLPLNTVGNLQSRDMDRGLLPIIDASGNIIVNYPDRPTFSHTSNLGYSVNEISPLYALQNACDAVTTNNASTPSVAPGLWYSQYDNPVNTTSFNVDVATTQLRNLLAGTIPQTDPSPKNGVNYSDNRNLEHNWVFIQNTPYYMPNGMADPNDFGTGSPASQVVRTNSPVPGRWGEPEGIPTVLTANSVTGYANNNNSTPPYTFVPVHAYENPVRAGRSFLNGNGSTTDAFDDDFDATDFLSIPPMGATNDNTALAYAQPGNDKYSGRNGYSTIVPSNNDRWNFFDNAGGLALPVERIRRFVTPIDPVGVGRIVKWDDRVDQHLDYGKGPDKRGRVNNFRYFRPAGLPQTVTYLNPATAYTLPTNFPTWITGATERYNMPILTYPAQAPPTLGDASNNQYAGHWSRQFPKAGIGGGTGAGIAVSAAVPFDYYFDSATPGNSQRYAPSVSGAQGANAIGVAAGFVPNSYVSTTTSVNSTQGPYLGPITSLPLPPTSRQNPAAAVVNGYPNYPPFIPSTVGGMNPPVANNGSSLNKDEADEMDLYGRTSYGVDMPFGPSDLEWLYRKQDVDGSSLDSRLAKLAPISFLNPSDGVTRRRMFSTDAWDTINFSYAFDNPQNAFPWNSRFTYYPLGAAPTLPLPGSSFAAMSYTSYSGGNPVANYANDNSIYQIANPVLFGATSATPNTSLPQSAAAVPTPLNPAFNLPLTPANLRTYLNNNGLRPVLTPPVAHRDRKINLNFPLPVSNDPAEPVRQKWIRETYQMFKAILPPQAVDTPYELAKLSQFVVNIIDFRDPDCTTTRFVNTDVQVIPATATNPSTLIFATDPVPDANVTESTGHYPFDPTIPFDTNYTPRLTNQFLVQHGMEYSPVAITEILAYQYQRKTSPSDSTSIAQKRFYIELINTLTDDGQSTNTSDLDLTGWDLVVLPDNSGLNRPDPITGEIPLTPIPGTSRWPISLGASNKVRALSGTDGAALTPFVLGFTNPGLAANPNTESNAPTLSSANLPATLLPTLPHVPAQGSGQWFWLYLRRPANPFDTTFAVPEMVVVDSYRFPYFEAGGDGEVVMGMDRARSGDSSNRTIWSSHRFQPYRGGHLVPTSTVVAGIPSTALGYSEQTAPVTAATTGNRGTLLQWGTENPTAYPARTIYHTLGVNSSEDEWGNFPFHDRDFMSPAELLLVPGCPPGLFTKQFVERPYLNPGDSRGTARTDANITSPATVPTTSVGATFNPPAPAPPVLPVNPYLPDEFYYSAASVAPHPSATVYPSKIGGWTGAGWYKMFEFVEVPSSANGAIGPVAQGTNFDWDRQDRKPGQLNLNLIVDEEVFFGLMDDPRLNTQLVNAAEGALGGVLPILPHIVSQIDVNGYPMYRGGATPSPANPYFLGAYPISTLQTYTAYDPNPNANGLLAYDATAPYVVRGPSLQGRGFAVQRLAYKDNTFTFGSVPKYYYTQGLKAAFSDFLKLRHGGSGFMFGWGGGATGQGNYNSNPPVSPATTTAIASERPFRSLAFPDINYTVMRPATLPPSDYTNPPFPDSVNSTRSWQAQIAPATTPAYPLRAYQYADDAGNLISTVPTSATSTYTPQPTDFVMDPGVKNPYLDEPTVNQKLVPIIPTRRLFQIPDKTNTGTPPSNAAQFDTPSVNSNVNQTTVSSDWTAGNQVLSSPAASLVSPDLNTAHGLDNQPQKVVDPALSTLGSTNSWWLGANDPGNGDNRQQPYFRTEWLQKVMNLTTVRTHQFAVWITIGFFEVVQSGAPALFVPDKLGAELSHKAGRAIRYRSFFILDRTRAVGFNPNAPIDFRDVVTYRRRIE